MKLPPLCKLSSVCAFMLTGISAQADILVGYDFDDGIGNGTLEATFTHPHLISTDFEVGAGLLAIVDSSFAPTDGLDAQLHDRLDPKLSCVQPLVRTPQ